MHRRRGIIESIMKRAFYIIAFESRPYCVNEIMIRIGKRAQQQWIDNRRRVAVLIHGAIGEYCDVSIRIRHSGQHTDT